IVVIIAAFAVYAFFSGGPGILQWLYPNEMFPTEVRATAVGVAIAISRIGVVVSTYGLPLFLGAYGIGPTMLVGAGLLVLALVLSVFMAPETRGLTLAEASSLRPHPPVVEAGERFAPEERT
ncbi:MAG: MFS transporter, partial [Phenylobacterium zucineum]